MFERHNKANRNRLEVYQLYYLPAHVNLFGGGCVKSVRSILRHRGQ